MDEYVLLSGLGEGSYAAAEGRAADLAQTDMAFKVAVPLLPGDEANFVTGLAVDYSNAVRSGGGGGRRETASAHRFMLICYLLPGAPPSKHILTALYRSFPPAKTQEPLEHPRDPERNLPPVPASCILLLATIDGALRFYRLANFLKRDGLARGPEPPPVGTAPWIGQAVAAAKKGAAEEEVRGLVGFTLSPTLPVL
jgi:hypothetical protein